MGNLGTIIVKTGFKKLPKLQLIAQSGHFDGEPDGIEGQQQEQQQQQNSSNTFLIRQHSLARWPNCDGLNNSGLQNTKLFNFCICCLKHLTYI